MIRQMFRRALGALSGLVRGHDRKAHQAPAPKVFDLPVPDFAHKELPRIKRRKAPESWHRFCRARAQWRRDLRDALNAANGPQPSNRERMKMAQSQARRVRAGLTA